MAAEEEEGLFASLISMVAGLLTVLGISEENAQRYAAWLVYGGMAVVAFVVVIWVIRFIRGK